MWITCSSWSCVCCTWRVCFLHHHFCIIAACRLNLARTWLLPGCMYSDFIGYLSQILDMCVSQPILAFLQYRRSSNELKSPGDSEHRQGRRASVWVDGCYASWCLLGWRRFVISHSISNRTFGGSSTENSLSMIGVEFRLHLNSDYRSRI